MALDKNKSTIDYLRMEPANNGFIISYTQKIRKNTGSKNTFDDCSYKEQKEVYDIDPGDNEEDDLNKAFARFKELAMMQYTQMKG